MSWWLQPAGNAVVAAAGVVMRLHVVGCAESAELVKGAASLSSPVSAAGDVAEAAVEATAAAASWCSRSCSTQVY